MFDAMDEAAAVVALRDGDLSAFGHIYDRYSDRLHAYAVTLLGDREAAADAVHDAFLLAHDRIDQLRDPALLRPWLYAITRSQAQRVLRARGRTTDLEIAHDMRADEVRWDRSLDADEARLLVLAALEGLNDGDREVIELSLRHDIDNAALSRVLGQSSSHTSARVSRAKQQLDVALTAVLLLRTRGRDCDDLRDLIGYEATLTPLLRKRIARHAKDCDSCTGNRRRAIAVLPGVALALPFEGASEALRAALIGEGGMPRTDPQPRLNQGDPARFGRDGFPVADVGHQRRGAVLAGVAAVMSLVLVGVVGTSLGASPQPASATRTAPIVANPTTLPPTPSTTPAPIRSEAKPTATARPDASSAPTPTAMVAEAQANAVVAPAAPIPSTKAARPPAKPPSAPLAAPAATPSVSVAWSDLDPSACGAPFDVQVSATITGASISSVTAMWRSSVGSGAGTVSLVRAADEWRGVLSGIPDKAEAVLAVRVVTAQGVTKTSSPEALTNVCGG
jgi:RNA polymerase sigma factor (sigma-70 family)